MINMTAYQSIQVIKALFDYNPDPSNTQELGFAKGDFFHVISREDDQSWYEACNPLIPSARGLVPVTYFEVIGKTEGGRQSGGSATSGSSHVTSSHDLAYADRSTHARQESTTGPRKHSHSRMPSVGKGSGAMVYGIVQYDFSAERPDELEAKAGEAIIVIAQSNPEWFVAKPIGRLGGPGLIPVSFIEIRDMSTGQAVPDAQAAVTRAGVPKVEEWKKMAADYKNSSITLGKFEAANAGPKDFERMSLNNESNGSPYVSVRAGFSDEQTLILTTRIRGTTKGSHPGVTRMATIDDHNAPGLPQYPLRYLDTFSKMTSTGTLLNAKWKTGDIGSSPVSTRSFMIFRLLFYGSFPTKQSLHPAARECCHSCLGRSHT